MNLRALIAGIESAAADPRHGLPQEVFRFISRMTPLINVDLLIQDGGPRTLLTWRDDEFYGPGWHVPGGIIRYKETAADRIGACAREELGAGVSSDPAPLGIYETISKEPTRGHHISLLFRCRLLSPPEEGKRAGDSPKHGQWRWHDRCPPDLIEEQREYTRLF
jgi:ADP-ribose pyrophosphatase YjhB (NUDIX family)